MEFIVEVLPLLRDVWEQMQNRTPEQIMDVPVGSFACSTTARLAVGRPAVEQLASPQQAPGRLHEETWAGRDHRSRA